MNAEEAIRHIQLGRRADDVVILEGHHPLRHALRFGATLRLVIATEDTEDDAFPDGCPEPIRVTQAQFGAAVRHAPARAVVALAERPDPRPAVRAAVADARGPVVLLESPTHLGNIGAVIRVAAAAGAAAVVTTGKADPWSPSAVRGAAGLQFAIPTLADRLAGALEVLAGRPLLALDPDGEHLPASAWPDQAVLAFGTERSGLSPDLLARCEHRIALPMREGVSSLNLATSVAATLYQLPGAVWPALEGASTSPYAAGADRGSGTP